MKNCYNKRQKERMENKVKKETLLLQEQDPMKKATGKKARNDPYKFGISNDKLIKKVFGAYLLTSIISSIVAAIGPVVDGIVTGQFLGIEAVSAIGFAAPINLLISALIGIISDGGSACCSNHIGKKNIKMIHSNFSVAVWSGLVVGIFFSLLCLFAAPTVAYLLGARGTVADLTAEYLRGLGIGFLPMTLVQILIFYMRMNDGKTHTIICALVMTVVNVVLDVFFTVKLNMGMFGMGLATSLSFIAAIVVCIINVFKKDSIFKIVSPMGLGGELKQIVITGIPTVLKRISITGRGVALNYILMSLGGSIAVSALSVQNNCNQLLNAVTLGVGATCMMIAGVFYGEKDEKELEKSLRVSIVTGLVLSIILAVIVWIFATPLVGMFLKGNREEIMLAKRALCIYGLSLPFALISNVLINFYQATGNIKTPTILSVFKGFVFPVLFAWGTSAFIHTDAVWFSFVAAEILSILLLCAIIVKKEKHLPRSFRDFMMLEADFTPSEAKVLDLTLTNDMDKVMKLSQQIGIFCEEACVDERRSKILSLAIEEMAGNIVRFGYTKQGVHNIDIRIMVLPEHIIFRVRDDGQEFNPLACSAEDERSLGIRMVRQLGKDIQYSRAIGMNNLTVII